MAKPDIKTISDKLNWSYANLAMAHAALKDGVSSYSKIHYAIRTRFFRDLSSGSISPGPLFNEDRVKYQFHEYCAYCGQKKRLTMDHLVPKHYGGSDSSDNIIWVCQICNSSKGSRDLLEWYSLSKLLPPLFLLRRYLKLAFEWCRVNGFLDTPLDKYDRNIIPFALNLLPDKWPKPSELCLYVNPVE